MTPVSLYDLRTSVAHGGVIRGYGFLLRLRAQWLLDRYHDDETLGLRHAVKALALCLRAIKCAERSLSSSETSFFSEDMHAGLEKRFAEYWSEYQSDVVETPSRLHSELFENLEYINSNPPSDCRDVGMEIHALLRLYLRDRYGQAIMEPLVGQRVHSHELQLVVARFEQIVHSHAA